MKVGMTYDLREEYLSQGYSLEETAEFDKNDTIDTIAKLLESRGFLVDRIGNVKNLINRLANSDANGDANGDAWDFVFNICEGMHGIAREAQVPAILDAYNIPYTFSDPLVLSLTLNKALTKNIVRDMGVRTPDFIVITNEGMLDSVDLKYPLFVKPIGEGTGKGISKDAKIMNDKEFKNVCSRLLEKYKQPILVESFLSGREMTVGVVGTGDAAKTIGVMEIIFSNSDVDFYSYEVKENYEKLVTYSIVEGDLAKKCEELALMIWRGLGCRDAGRIDFRLDDKGVPHFLEINPLAGLNPKHSDLPIMCSRIGTSYESLINQIIDSVLSRINA